ncbi:ChbG/HpnK family deacetylase [Mucilaginibacter pallidiroseus]|uniref:ChbG/HpnK family deacetylase n=1 Tax=Mucilaginibacter pallidiroseus TaxID=2599295 RepID=A0A563U888_9SPHI|nr:ChbG/HpnK family deacetylase [Mucilaginibacter pallidiroseus]TWR27601.1 ChbG/HpnK family deacetylase [Mucilaginibacter pallidiroseus]
MVLSAIPNNTIINADDLGLNKTINLAILKSFELGIINSSSLIVNMGGFNEAVELIKSNRCMQGIGIHVNLAEGRPLIFNDAKFIDENGFWNINATNKATAFLNARNRKSFLEEIRAQIVQGINTGLSFTHLDSHYHIHTLPAFFPLFFEVAKEFNLKLRLAQTYNEGNYAKFLYRKWINNRVKKAGLNYTDYFETVQMFLRNTATRKPDSVTEVMLHPDLQDEKLTDHTDEQAMKSWLNYLG